MPTAAKLIAALCFAGLGWLVAAMVAPRAVQPVHEVLMPLGCASLGLILGWTMLGRHAGEGTGAAMSWALTTAVAVAASSVLLWSLWRMLRRATRLRYGGPGEALADLAVLALDGGRLLLHGPTLIVALAGAVVAGLLSAQAARRLP